MDYFPHDTKAMSDDKLLALRIEGGLEAVACYWSVLEKIYADEKPFDMSETNVETKSVLYRLGVGSDVFRKHVSTMVEYGLLEADVENPNLVMSERARKQIEELDRKREIARQNGKSGGRKPKSAKPAKPRKTDVGSNGKPKSASNKTLNGIGFDKQNQIPKASDGAAVAEATPPSAFQCPTCGMEMERTNSHRGDKVLHRCKLCAEEVWA